MAYEYLKKSPNIYKQRDVCDNKAPLIPSLRSLKSNSVNQVLARIWKTKYN